MRTLSINNSHLVNVNNSIVSHNSSMSIILLISNEQCICGRPWSPMSNEQRESTLL